MLFAHLTFLVVVHRNWLVFKQYVAFSLVPDILDNLIWFGAFALGVGSMVTSGQDEYIRFLVPGAIILTGLYYSSSEMTYSLLPKLDSDGLWTSILSTPVSLKQLMLGETLWATLRGMFSAVCLYLICLTLGFIEQPIFSLLGFVIVFISYFAFCSFGMFMTSCIKKMQLFSYYWVLWLSPSMLFSGIYFEVSKLPKVAEAIASFVPMTHSVSMMQKIYLGKEILVTDILSFSAIMLALTAFSFIFAHKNFKKRLFD